MDAIVLSSKGQLVIPKAIRERAKLSPGDRLAVRLEEGEIRLKLLPRRGAATLQDVAGCLAMPGRKLLTEAQTKAAIRARLKARLSSGGTPR